MRRVVLDASTLVGALLKPGSVPYRALVLAQETIRLLLSPATEDELRRVLQRPKFQRYLLPGEAGRYVELILAAAEHVDPVSVITACRDPQDDKYLALALDGAADVIVSSDQDLLALDPWRGIPILGPAGFLARFGG